MEQYAKKYIVCEDCHGNGYIRQETNEPASVENTVVCSVCRGSGHNGDMVERL